MNHLEYYNKKMREYDAKVVYFLVTGVIGAILFFVIIWVLNHYGIIDS